MDFHLFTELPRLGAWRLLGTYEGFEVVRFAAHDNGIVLEGTTVGVEDGVPWAIHYVIEVDKDWHARHATVKDHAGTQVEIRADGKGSWRVNDERRTELDGCLDVDFEASVVTNTLPVHRLSLSVGQHGESAAAYIRSNGLAVERLDQTYHRLPDAEGKVLLDYKSPRFGYRDTLHYGPDGLILHYPRIGARVPLRQ